MATATSIEAFNKPSKTQSIIKVSLILGMSFFLSAGWVWWRQVHMSPHKVFWVAINNALATPSITRHITQSESGATLDQQAQLQLKGQPLVHTTTIISQQNTDGKTKVITEGISTPAQDFNRYVNINTTLKSQSNQSPNFKNIENVWGENTVSPTSPATVFNQNLLGIIPFADLQSKDRQALFAYMQHTTVYKPNYSVKHDTYEGRAIYVYDVAINAPTYINMLHQFADMLGLHNITGLSPSDYADAGDFNVNFSIDPLSRQIVNVVFPNNNRSESYSSQGSLATISLPQKTVPASQLQAQLQSLRQ